MELSGEFPVKLLCEMMNIQRSSFYAWKKKLSRPSERTKNLVSNIRLFQEYHLRFPSHGYRWLNAKLRLDTGLVLSDPYAHKCCKIAGIKSKAKHYQYKQCSMCLGRGSTFCAACGGTGRTMRMVNVMDPVTHNFTMRSESSICLSCGGSGSIRCSACGGTGGHY